MMQDSTKGIGNTPKPFDVGTPLDIGSVKRVKIRCVSETGWFDTPTLLADLKSTGKDLATVDQYDLPLPPFGDLHPENAGGSSSLVEIEEQAGGMRRFLFDSGWNTQWMDKRFAEEGIDGMLQRGEIEFLVISHEHFDHFWGIDSTIKHKPDIPIYVPDGFHEKGFQLIAKSGHTGPVHVVTSEAPVIPFPGLAIAYYPMKTLGNVEGENVLYVNLTDKGLAMITGCGHGGALNLLDYAKRAFQGGSKIHAVYGGLHISPFGEWNEELDRMVTTLGEYGIDHFACNHCTGEKAVQRMIELGLPVTRGSAKNGSQSDIYIGNGDVFEVGR
uniref:7,8-dihydropterin-6-yl-methyl-4-(Beta-D-ribofuranosyl)aminobenzene 5'-phosphate synthase n=1 Tax=Candidatus Kentrum sp. SD TaxID=2126332 RepID=A0A450YCU3_9GAMM|nr:MAG: 7,8-dihydropterin-6-yl-methyl-4-(beta-D-ribofuranosyl)aminobenzene 5'-phosphate synthase [Candidatus Kentron sp. SD]VFK46619.1 MAG: 7,8-dihydropterin-6-yl-methyl-4-(beta-D-ribofuranosyl)aminobenzene 5'-phosphate synthase [Candidatus Kentron sp. SD]VFK80096.1 MAG: 7,8-dihydropterin-6-yl-methyl-4-(beta-D-ribofuranosyl)aminobenzene 5'-phosphate synthase [Candidatus Kentron sp. SD]